ncbi:hypothetical protein AAFA46_01500 [Oscillospiraceae bacterium WX1]
MKRKGSRTEKIKNAVIVFLLFSAVTLGWESNLFGNTSGGLADDVSSLIGFLFGGEHGAGRADKTTEAAKPVIIAVTDQSGVRTGVQYDLNAIGALYEKTSGIVTAAFAASAKSKPSEISVSDWQSALKAPGLYYEYLSPIKLTVLDGWFGADMSGTWDGVTVRRLCVAEVGGKNRLYIEDSGTGRFFSNDVDSVSITSLAAAAGTSHAVFAFEVLGGMSSNPYQLLFVDSSAHPSVAVSNPLTDDSALAGVLTALGAGTHATPSYQESDGTRVYVENDFTIRVLAAGTVQYKRVYKNTSAALAAGDSAVIEKARAIVAETVGAHSGDAAVYFDALQRRDDGSFEVTFNYIVAGGVVRLSKNGYAADVIVKNGVIEEMTLRFKNFQVTDKQVELMPEKQAAAAAGGEFVLCYTESGEYTLDPAWMALHS